MSAEALQGLVDSINERMRNAIQMQHDNHQVTMMHHAMTHQNLLEQLTKPKEVVRDSNGRILGVR